MLAKYQELVELHRDRVYTLARTLLRDRETAADVTQEVLIRLWRHLPELEGNLGAWLARVTRNCCYDELRRRRSQTSALGTESPAEVLEDHAAASPSPERLAGSAQLGRRLRAAVAALGEPYRSVILMREVQEMKYQEIAETLDIPLNTVKIQIHRARRLLRDRIEEVNPHVAAL